MSLKTLTNIGNEVQYEDDKFISVGAEDLKLSLFWKNPQFILLRLIYYQSIVDLNNHYENCAMLTYKTHNSQQDLNNLEYYVFTNLISYIQKILKEEADAQNSAESNESAMDNYSKMQSSSRNMFNNMKSGFKMPKL